MHDQRRATDGVQVLTAGGTRVVVAGIAEAVDRGGVSVVELVEILRSECGIEIGARGQGNRTVLAAYAGLDGLQQIALVDAGEAVAQVFHAGFEFERRAGSGGRAQGRVATFLGQGFQHHVGTQRPADAEQRRLWFARAAVCRRSGNLRCRRDGRCARAGSVPARRRAVAASRCASRGR